MWVLNQRRVFTKSVLLSSLHTHFQSNKHHNPVTRTWSSRLSRCGRSSLWPGMKKCACVSRWALLFVLGPSEHSTSLQTAWQQGLCGRIEPIDKFNQSITLNCLGRITTFFSNTEWASILLSERRSSITDRATELAGNSTHKNWVFMKSNSLHLRLVT